MLLGKRVGESILSGPPGNDIRQQAESPPFTPEASERGLHSDGHGAGLCGCRIRPLSAVRHGLDSCGGHGIGDICRPHLRARGGSKVAGHPGIELRGRPARERGVADRARGRSGAAAATRIGSAACSFGSDAGLTRHGPGSTPATAVAARPGRCSIRWAGCGAGRASVGIKPGWRSESFPTVGDASGTQARARGTAVWRRRRGYGCPADRRPGSAGRCTAFRLTIRRPDGTLLVGTSARGPHGGTLTRRPGRGPCTPVWRRCAGVIKA